MRIKLHGDTSNAKRKEQEQEKQQQAKQMKIEERAQMTAKQKITRIVIYVACTLAGIGLLLGCTYLVLKQMGRYSLSESLTASNAVALPETELVQLEEADQDLPDGYVRYEGKVYCYNEDITTILCLGIDKKAEMTSDMIPGDGGQADCVFLLVLDNDTKQMKLIAVSRETMTDVDVYDINGIYHDTEILQLALQYAYGDGKEESAARMAQTVSDLFYGLPINAYVAINMSAIAPINDAVGGVEVQVLEDLTAQDTSLIEGNTVNLMGNSAFWYVKWRNYKSDEPGTNNKRMARQKQYMNAFVNKAKSEMKQDMTLPVKLYQLIRPYMTTDITLDKVTYLATTALDYQFDASNIITIDGESVVGEEHDEFYIDEDDLYRVIIENFYEEAPEYE